MFHLFKHKTEEEKKKIKEEKKKAKEDKKKKKEMKKNQNKTQNEEKPLSNGEEEVKQIHRTNCSNTEAPAPDVSTSVPVVESPPTQVNKNITCIVYIFMLIVPTLIISYFYVAGSSAD